MTRDTTGITPVQDATQTYVIMKLPDISRYQLDRNVTVVIVAAMICATVLFCAVFIWPTPYRYESVQPRAPVSGAVVYVVRINRFTGHVKLVFPPTGNDPSR